MDLRLGEDIVKGVMGELTNEDPYSETSTEFRYECPFCHNIKIKFYISKEKGLYICYNCGKQGNFLNLIIDLTGLTFREALSYLQDDWDIGKISSYSPDLETSFYDQLLETLAPVDIQLNNKVKLVAPSLPTNTRLLADNLSNAEAYPFFKYLASRGITLNQIKQQRICYVIVGTFRSLDKENSITNSIIFPSFNDQGQMIYWSSRSIEYAPYIKSINAPALPQEYSRKEVVYNLNQVQQRCRVVVCEGVFNALTANFPPLVIGVATFGKNVTDAQISLLKNKSSLIQKYYLFLDSDARREQLNLAARLNKLGVPQNKIYLVNNHSIQDANDLGRSRVLQLLRSAKPMNNLEASLDFLLNT